MFQSDEQVLPVTFMCQMLLIRVSKNHFVSLLAKLLSPDRHLCFEKLVPSILLKMKLNVDGNQIDSYSKSSENSDEGPLVMKGNLIISIFIAEITYFRMIRQ